MSSYVYDPAWEQERERLDALSAAHDPASKRFLSSIGISAGWRCLEVGAGAGSIARWMAEQVGTTGRVVATDLSLVFAGELKFDNLELREHNILTDPLEEGAFDVAHARFVLEHLSEPEGALDRMVSALRPGGWVLIEDVDMEPAIIPTLSRYCYPSEESGLYERIQQGLATLFSATGASPGYGARLPHVFIDAGLENVSVEIHAPYYWGTQAHEFGRLTVSHLREQLVGAGLVSKDDIERYLTMSGEGLLGYVTFLVVSAWGQRPA